MNAAHISALDSATAVWHANYNDLIYLLSYFTSTQMLTLLPSRRKSNGMRHWNNQMLCFSWSVFSFMSSEFNFTLCRLPDSGEWSCFFYFGMLVLAARHKEDRNSPRLGFLCCQMNLEIVIGHSVHCYCRQLDRAPRTGGFVETQTVYECTARGRAPSRKTDILVKISTIIIRNDST